MINHYAYLLPLLIAILIFHIGTTYFMSEQILATSKPNEYLVVIKNNSQILTNETAFNEFKNDLEQNRINVTFNPDFATIILTIPNITKSNSNDGLTIEKLIMLIFSSNLTETSNSFNINNVSTICSIIQLSPYFESCEPNLVLPPP